MEKEERGIDIEERTSRIFRFFNRPVMSIVMDKSWHLNFMLVSKIDFQLPNRDMYPPALISGGAENR